MADAVIELLRDRQKASKMGMNGRARVERELGMSGYMAKNHEIYADALA
jgi:glycosyltransferase involved in cell wall biosynthesis